MISLLLFVEEFARVLQTEKLPWLSKSFLEKN